MKTLDPITVGNYKLEVFADHVGGAVVEVTVNCDGHSLARRMNHQGSHDHTEAQFFGDIEDFAKRLAGELAGKIRSAELASKLASS